MFLKWDPAEHETIERNSHGPNIRCLSRDLAMLGNTKLWWHKSGGAGRFCSPHFPLLVEHFRYAKIHNLEDIIFGNEAIVRFDIAMDDALGMD